MPCTGLYEGEQEGTQVGCLLQLPAAAQAKCLLQRPAIARLHCIARRVCRTRCGAIAMALQVPNVCTPLLSCFVLLQSLIPGNKRYVLASTGVPPSGDTAAVSSGTGGVVGRSHTVGGLGVWRWEQGSSPERGDGLLVVAVQAHRGVSSCALWWAGSYRILAKPPSVLPPGLVGSDPPLMLPRSHIHIRHLPSLSTSPTQPAFCPCFHTCTACHLYCTSTR